MKIAVIGDPHFANRRLFGYPTDITGVNTRLKYIWDVFAWIGRDLPEDVDHIVVLGDITHEHGRLTPPVLAAVNMGLGHLWEMHRKIFLLSGNHDIDQNNISIVPAFACPGIDPVVPYEPIAWGLKDHVLFFIPYAPLDDTMKVMETFGSIKENTHWGSKAVVFMHHHFEGAKHGAHEFQPPGGINPKDIPNWVDLVISGHYHMHHRLTEKILYAGAPLQHDFGEANYIPGYLLLNEDLSYEFRETPLDVAPRYHIITPEDNIPGNPDFDYYRVDFTTDIPLSDLEHFKEELTNVIFKPLPITAEGRSRVSEVLQKESEHLGAKDVLEAYVKMNAQENQVEELIDIGKGLLSE